MKICLAAKKETLRFNLLAGTPPLPPPPPHSPLPLPPSSFSVHFACLPLDSISFSVNLSCCDLFAVAAALVSARPRRQRWSFFLTRSQLNFSTLLSFLFGPHGVLYVTVNKLLLSLRRLKEAFSFEAL